MMVADQLKSATETSHQQLEKQLVLKMKAIRSSKEYVDLLQLFYTYFGGLEEQIKPYITRNNLPDFAERRKTEALAADIEAFGAEPQTIAVGDDLPQLQNDLQAFGALYVMEGSTLGGQIITKMMGKQLNLPTDAGFSFFKGYGEASMPMWDTFKQALNAQAQNNEQAEIIIGAANETFAKFEEWIDKNRT